MRGDIQSRSAQCGADQNEKKHTLGYLTWGLFKIKGNMQYGLCRVSKLNEKRYTTYTRQMWDLVLKMKAVEAKSL